MGDGASGVFKVLPGEAGGRLDLYLLAKLGCSRGRVQQAIADGGVSVNGRGARPSYRLRSGDEIEVSVEEADLEAPAVAALVPEALPVSVLYEDDDLAVLDKPAGMVVHPAGEVVGGTLANALAHRWGAAPGLVHRLDRDTSGVMVVARTAEAQGRLTEQFRGRAVSKHYVALVHGRVAAAGGVFDAPLGRDKKNRLKMVACAPGEGRAALTLYAVRARWEAVTLLDVEIKTGRTHQIRVHCAHAGHPVVADEMYGRGRTAQTRDAALRGAFEALGRQFLHAARLGFEHPRTGERLGFEASLPSDLRACLAEVERVGAAGAGERN